MLCCMCPEGEHSYTVPLALGRAGLVAKIEVHIRAKGFRVVKPKLTRLEMPLVKWGDDAHAAWMEAKARAVKKIDGAVDLD